MGAVRFDWWLWACLAVGECGFSVCRRGWDQETEVVGGRGGSVYVCVCTFLEQLKVRFHEEEKNYWWSCTFWFITLLSVHNTNQQVHSC